MREQWNDMPGDVGGESAENLPGGFGVDDPDNSVEATIDELVDNDLMDTPGHIASSTDSGGITSGTGYAAAVNDGSTVDYADLLAGEEAGVHPGAAVGFTGAEPDKAVPEWAEKYPEHPAPAPGATGAGGATGEPETSQMERNFSTETASGGSTEGAAGTIPPEEGKEAA